MADIPLPPRSHHQANKLTDKEQEKRNKKLSSSILTRGWVKNKEDKRCNPREVSLDFRGKYEEAVYPVCPLLRKWIKQEKRYSLPDIKKTNLPQLDSIIKILVVFNSLTQLRPNLETVVRWAHSENLLTERLDLIRNDLLALPQSLEKDFPETAKECKELVAELKLAEWRYSMHGQSFVYLLPYNLEYGNWATFLEWRELQGNRAKLRSFSTEIEMCRLTRHYPAEAIKVMRKICDELYPLAQKILPEKIKESNRIKADLKKMLEEHLTRPAGTEGDDRSDSNVSGMRWQDAQKKAEALVDEKGYLGHKKLYKAVGCADNTLRKAIEKSSKLRQAKEQYESTSKTLKAVGFTAKVVATYEDSSGSQLSDSETSGILAEMLDRIKRERPEMFERTKKQLDEMNPDGKRRFAAIYQRDYQNKDKSLSKDGPKTQRQYKQV